MLSGVDDLVRQRAADGTPVPDDTAGPDFAIRRYRPRTEGSFLRIERWTHLPTGDVHWRTLSPDNVLSVYGREAASRIADPADPGRVYAWLLCQVRDDVGNGIVYTYKGEDAVGVDLAATAERSRGATAARRAPPTAT